MHSILRVSSAGNKLNDHYIQVYFLEASQC